MMTEFGEIKKIVERVADVVKAPGPQIDLEQEFLADVKTYFNEQVAKPLTGLTGTDRAMTQDENTQKYIEFMSFLNNCYFERGKLDTPEVAYRKFEKAKKAKEEANQA